MPHIIDLLIEERAEELMRNPRVWEALKTFLYPLLKYERCIEIADTLAPMRGLEIMQYLSGLLEIDIHCEGLEYVPRIGRAVVMPNHPSGIADGIAVFDALYPLREDFCIFANRDTIRIAEGFADVVVPVEWMEHRRSHERRRETVKSMVRAFKDDRLIVIFPSGRLAQPTLAGLRERPWHSTALNVAIKYGCPVIPMHVKGHNSALYYLFYLLHHELRDITLFRELLNKRGKPYHLKLGAPFDPGQALERHGSLDALAEALRVYVAEALPRGDLEFIRTA